LPAARSFCFSRFDCLRTRLDYRISFDNKVYSKSYLAQAAGHQKHFGGIP